MLRGLIIEAYQR